MRVRNVSMLAAAVAAVGLASAASAITINYNGKISFDIVNYDVGTNYAAAPLGNTYTGQVNVDNAPGQIAPTGALLGEDGWGLVKILRIYKTSNPGFEFYNVATSPKEITGIYWGLTDVNLEVKANGDQEIESTGLQLAFFEDAKANTPFDAAANAVNAPGNRVNIGNQPTFSGVTDGTLLWTFRSTTGFNAAWDPIPTVPTAEYFVNLTLQGGGGLFPFLADGGFNATTAAVDGYGWGPNNNNFIANPVVTTQFNANPPDPGDTTNWLVFSYDPTVVDKAVAIPTPSAVWGGALLAGMAAMNIYRRRRAND